MFNNHDEYAEEKPNPGEFEDSFIGPAKPIAAPSHNQDEENASQPDRLHSPPSER